jgi:hypothetical protein
MMNESVAVRNGMAEAEEEARKAREQANDEKDVENHEPNIIRNENSDDEAETIVGFTEPRGKQHKF